MVLLHDMASCIKTLVTQQCLNDSGLNFWGNEFWSGNSADLNAAERIGPIIKDEVENKMLNENSANQYNKEVLERNLREVRTSLENRTDLFESLLLSYPQRLKAVIAAVRTPHKILKFCT